MVLTAPKALAVLTAAMMVLAGTLLLTTDQVRDPSSSDTSVTYSGERVIHFYAYDGNTSGSGAVELFFTLNSSEPAGILWDMLSDGPLVGQVYHTTSGFRTFAYIDGYGGNTGTAVEKGDLFLDEYGYLSVAIYDFSGTNAVVIGKQLPGVEVPDCWSMAVITRP